MNNAYSPFEVQAFCQQFYATAQDPTPRLLIVPYGYQLVFNALSATLGAVATQQLSITGNADFLLLQTSYFCPNNGDSTALRYPNFSMLITDSGSNEQYSNGAIILSNYSNNVRNPNMLPYPRFISGRSSLTVQITNTGSTEGPDLFVYFEGVLIRKL